MSMNPSHNITYALCDVNSFYVSCERIFRPDLTNKPVIVLSNNDGCIISISKEAKQLGIKMAVPLHEAKHLIKKYNIATFSSNYGLYGDISQRFNWLLEQHCDHVSSYSVDESFLLFKGFHEDLTAKAQHIKNELTRTLSLPTCIGLGPTKTLAKLANHYAKKHPSTNGVVDLSNMSKRQWVLQNVAVNNVWGIGRQLSKKLIAYDIKTAWDLYNAEPKTLQRIFSVNMERTILELKGQPSLNFQEKPKAKKSILNSRSFGQKITAFSDLKEALAYHTTRCCEKLRKQDSLASSISLFLYAGKVNNDYLYRPHVTVTLSEATNDTSVFLKAVDSGLKRIYREGEHYKKAGVMLSGITEQQGYQPSLFNPLADNPKLMKSLDRINQRYGKDCVKMASLGVKQNWAMRANSRSPQYTCRWEDLIKVN